MKIGAQTNRSSAICASNESTILVRGRDLVNELVGRIGFVMSHAAAAAIGYDGQAPAGFHRSDE